MNRVYNFNAGPAILPVPVLEEVSRGVLEIAGSGMSILEVSHRGKDYEAIHFDARDRLLKLLGLSIDQYSVLFLAGGASQQFAMLPMNYIPKDAEADYVHTGEWSNKAMKEAKHFGKVNVAATSEAQKFSIIPKDFKFSSQSKYVHITTNNTIEGTEFTDLPQTSGVPLIADMSSNILGRNYDFSKFSMIYAGAQKNLGPAGVTVVIMKKSFLELSSEAGPAVMGYKTHAEADSLYNTPPAFAIYTVGLVAKWIDQQGGLNAVAARNHKKAALIYQALDEHSDIYDPAVTDKKNRSNMNITFRLRDAGREKDFLVGAMALKMEGLKGHRSVGGFRASIYNAFPEEGCIALAKYIYEFAKK